MSGDGMSPEFEQRMQAIGARTAYMVIPPDQTRRPLAEYQFPAAAEDLPCRAKDRNTQALYELELQWGAGQLDYGKIRRILTGACEHQEDT